MNVHTWGKYLPVIRILIKRTSQNDQVFNLNSTDFPSIPAGKKGGSKFSLHMRNGIIVNNIGTSPMAKDLALALSEDPVTQPLISTGNFMFSLNTKNQLTIKLLPEEA